MYKTIYMMAYLLERNNILVPDGARKKDGRSGSKNKEKYHALVAGSYDPSTFIIDSGASRHMAYLKGILSSMHSNSGLGV